MGAAVRDVPDTARPHPHTARCSFHNSASGHCRPRLSLASALLAAWLARARGLLSRIASSPSPPAPPLREGVTPMASQPRDLSRTSPPAAVPLMKSTFYT